MSFYLVSIKLSSACIYDQYEWPLKAIWKLKYSCITPSINSKDMKSSFTLIPKKTIVYRETFVQFNFRPWADKSFSHPILNLH